MQMFCSLGIQIFDIFSRKIQKKSGKLLGDFQKSKNSKKSAL
jgi:hypothetical protein